MHESMSTSAGLEEAKYLVQELDEVSRELSAAAEKQDIERVAGLDRRCRDLIAELSRNGNQPPGALNVLTQAFNSVTRAAAQFEAFRRELTLAQGRERKLRAAYRPIAGVLP